MEVEATWVSPKSADASYGRVIEWDDVGSEYEFMDGHCSRRVTS